MNKKEQYVAAIDIGTTKIVAIVGKKNENGKIEILSNDGLYRIKNGQEDLENLDFCFDGTIVNIEFNIEKNKKYFLEGEITNEN